MTIDTVAMNAQSKKIANRIFYTVILLQICAAVLLCTIWGDKDSRFLRNILLGFLYFTAIPIAGTVLLVLQEKSEKRKKANGIKRQMGSRGK